MLLRFSINNVAFAVSLFIFILFLNRYVFGLWIRLARGKKSDDKIEGYQPNVTIVVPLFNEGKSIYKTIEAFAKLHYPKDKLSIAVVDDCSTDDSFEWANRAARDFEDRFKSIRISKNPTNMGKRRGINRAVREAVDAEIIVSIDSDVIVYPTALRELICRFTAPDIAAVGGRVHVSNPNENWLTKLQTIKYFFGQEYLKNLERGLEQVMCLSGCLTAYRRHVLIELEPILENRNVMGVAIKYGEDRFLTHQIVKHGYRTRMTMDAMCFTKAPPRLRDYFSQQLRWKRSNIVDFMVGIKHAWSMHPLLCVHYLTMLLLLFVYPFVIIHHLLEHEFIPLAFLHLQVIALFGMLYHFSPSVRRLPPWLRVHPIAFLPMTVMMPVAYLILTPLGFLTLDTSSWETRGHGAVVAAQGGGPK